MESILDRGNTLVVLPTGTGKTIIAFYLMIIKGEAFFLAPTKPLVKQHYSNFIKLFPELEEHSVIITGEVSKTKRKELYKRKFIFATPQTILKDNEKEIFELKKELFIFDECHRTVGKYAYSGIASKLKEKGSLIVGLTASPGGKDEKIKEVLDLLGIENVEIRTGKEEDIKEYVYKKEYKWVFVSLDPDLRRAVSNVKTLLKKYKEWFKSHHIKIPRTKSELISFRSKIQQIPKPFYFQVSTNYSILFNLHYMLELLETQGFNYFLNYYKKLSERKTKAVKILTSNSLIKEVVELAEKNIKENKFHPKFYKLLEVLEKNKDMKMIIFLQYIDTINLLYSFLKEKGFNVFKFTGRRKGFNKKEQQKVLDSFRKEEKAILISSSVGEEGIDIPSVDAVIFFDVVPSEIRSIQRKGRAGRTREGLIYFLITLNTIEVAFYRSSVKKEKLMKSKLLSFKPKKPQKPKPKELNKEDKEQNIKLRNKKGQLKISDYF